MEKREAKSEGIGGREGQKGGKGEEGREVGREVRKGREINGDEGGKKQRMV